MNVRNLIIASACVLGAACAPAAPKTDPAADAAGIAKVRDAYTAAMKAGDAAKIAATYTSDATVMNNAQPTAAGTAEVEAALKGMLGMMTGQELAITPTKTEVVGDIAYDIGTYRLSATLNPGGPMSEEGRYLIVLKRQADGSWKIAADMGNLPTAPAMAAPPPPAKK